MNTERTYYYEFKFKIEDIVIYHRKKYIIRGEFYTTGCLDNTTTATGILPVYILYDPFTDTTLERIPEYELIKVE